MILEYFQMVDRIVALDPKADTIRTSCQVPVQSPVFVGHFPGFARLPGALMIETMAQTGGWLVLARLKFAKMPFLTRVESAKLRRFVEPGELLDGEATLTHDGSGFAVIESVITTGGQKVASAEIRYVVGPFPNDTIRGAMLFKARQIGFPEDCLPIDRPPEDVSKGRAPEGHVPEGHVPEGRVPEGRVPEGHVPEGHVPQGRPDHLPEGRQPEDRQNVE